MTAMDAIRISDEMRPNAFDERMKIAWLKELDGRVKAEILDVHEGFDENIAFTDDGNRELLVPEPYGEIYVYYLFMKEDFMNGETERFNNDAIMHNTAWLNYANHVNRTHMPKKLAGIALKKGREACSPESGK